MATFLRDDSDLSVLTGVASTTVGSIRLTGTTIGLESDTDLLTLGNSLLDVNAANIHFNGSTLEFKDTSTDATTITLTQSTGNISCTSLTSTGDLTVSGGKITFGNTEFISNEIDGVTQMGGTPGAAHALVISSSNTYDSSLSFSSNILRWSVGYDASDTTDHPLLFNQGTGALGANTKMKLAQDGDLEIAGDLTVTGNKITFGAGGIIEEESSGAIMSFTTEAYYAFKSLSGENLNMFFYADNLEDNSDSWNFEFVDGGDFKIKSGATGGYVSIMELTNAGNLQIDGKITISGNIIEDNDGTDMITFDSSGNSTLAGNTTGTFIGNLTGTASNATLAVEATNSTIVANNSADETVYPTFVDGATGTQGLETDTGLTYNPSTGMLTSTGFTGALTGNSSTATEATNVTVSANNSADETVYPAFVDGATGTQGIETDTGLTYNPNSGVLTSTNFTGALTGNADTSTLASTITTADATADSTVYELTMVASGATTALKRDDALIFKADTHILSTVSFNASTSYLIGSVFTLTSSQLQYTDGNFEIDVNAGDIALDSSGDITFDADGGNVLIKDDSQEHFEFNCDNTYFDIYDDEDTGDYFRIQIAQHGATTISTVDDDATVAHLTLNPDGNLLLTPATEVKSDTPLKIKEASAAVADTNGYGQIWVKNTDPEELCFTDAGGTDIVGIGKYHYETKFVGFYAGQTAQYIPMTGYIIEKTSTGSNNEFISFVAPYNCTIEKFIYRSEVGQDGTFSLRILESSDATEVPASVIYRKDTTIDIDDDTFLDYDLTSPSVGSDYAPLTKGKIYAIYVSTPAVGYDTNITVVFKWDINS